jgi:hypothetical protein
MTEFNATPEGRSQNLMLDWNGKIVIPIKALKRLQILANLCSEGLMNPRDCTVLLTSLDAHLSESMLPEPARSSQALLLLKLYRDAVPAALELANQRLEEISTTVVAIMLAGERERAEGGNNEE